MSRGPYHARGKRIRERVAELVDVGMGISEIARKLAITRQTVQRYITGMHANGTDNPSKHRIRVGGEPCPRCHLRGEHVCLPDIGALVMARPYEMQGACPKRIVAGC